MKRKISINITIDSETAEVTAFDITEGLYHRVEFVMDEVDDPISIYDLCQSIYRELDDYLD